MELINQKPRSFTEEGIVQISGFCDILERIHNRLISEGYCIRNGNIYKPVCPPHNTLLDENHYEEYTNP
jgi:hypothetical protein